MVKLLQAQGWYYLLFGSWPLVHFESFEVVSGPKPDRFVTEVTSALYAVIGATLLSDLRKGAPTATGRRLAGLSSAVSALLIGRHRPDIRPVYLADAVLQASFVFAAAALETQARRREEPRG